MALPREGFKGKPPAFPLPAPSTRERAVWSELWKTPQACAWISESWRWRTVAQYVRWSVRMEQPDASAAIASTVHRLGDQIGMTPAGLRENGWKLAIDELGARREATEEPKAKPAARRSTRDRIKVVDGGA